MGQPIQEARLLRVEEAYELGCGNGASNCNSAPAFVKETSYWLGSANDPYSPWLVNSYGGFGSGNYYLDGDYGVRPVIII